MSIEDIIFGKHIQKNNAIKNSTKTKVKGKPVSLYKKLLAYKRLIPLTEQMKKKRLKFERKIFKIAKTYIKKSRFKFLKKKNAEILKRKRIEKKSNKPKIKKIKKKKIIPFINQRLKKKYKLFMATHDPIKLKIKKRRTLKKKKKTKFAKRTVKIILTKKTLKNKAHSILKKNFISLCYIQKINF